MRDGMAPQTAAEALLVRLAQHGIGHLFANGGTDFAPIIEGLARAPGAGLPVPEALPIAHETAAVAMAHGLHLATGLPQAVMVHTNVGLANAVMGLINAAVENIPLLVMSGRTPITEQGRLGSRNTPIGWGQEMRDQAAMIRETVKWDYELRYPEQVPEIVDRALAIAMSPPRGPVYLALPREVLCEPWPGGPLGATPTLKAAAPALPEAAALGEAARLLMAAERPLVIAQRSGDGERGWQALGGLAEALALPVCEWWPSRTSLAADHPMHAGADPHPDLAEADLVVVLDALVPWIRERAEPPADAKVIQIGPDPLFARMPVRGFRADLTLAGDTALILEALLSLCDSPNERAERRRPGRVALHAQRRAAAAARAETGAARPMSAAWIGHCLGESLPDGARVFSELGVDPAHLRPRAPGAYWCHALSGGLGWALPAALGAQLADRARPHVACVGDGSYLFANPVACHQIAEAFDLPILTIVLNNGIWGAVRGSTLALYPDGHAARANTMPVTSLAPSPDYCQVARASRAHAERIEDGAELPAALARAFEVIRSERRQVLLDLAVAVG